MDPTNVWHMKAGREQEREFTKGILIIALENYTNDSMARLEFPSSFRLNRTTLMRSCQMLSTVFTQLTLSSTWYLV